MKFKRVFLLVLDSLGVGESIDCEMYNDKGCNTLGHIKDNSNLFIPNISELGLLNTLYMNNSSSEGYYTIARPKNPGKDSISGHYEMMGLKSSIGKFYNQAFPRELLEEIASTIQVPLIGNILTDPSSIIDRLGDRQIEGKSLIIYTTGDSNLEIASEENVFPYDRLLDIAEKIRNITKQDKYYVKTVTLRTFRKENDHFVFTIDTRRFVEDTPTRGCLDILKENNLQTISIGKVAEIFNGNGITKVIKSNSNNEGINKLLDIMEKDFTGLCFCNLSDFDTYYGHARDVEGYKKCLEELDVEIPLILNKLNLDDLLIITADHGNDPTMNDHCHTRENVPVLVYSRSFINSGQLDILDSFADIGATIIDNYGLEKTWMGKSFLDKLK